MKSRRIKKSYRKRSNRKRSYRKRRLKGGMMDSAATSRGAEGSPQQPQQQPQPQLWKQEELQMQLDSGANFETWSSLLIPHLGHLFHEPVHNKPVSVR